MGRNRRSIDLRKLSSLDFAASVTFNGQDIVFQQRDQNGIRQLYVFDIFLRSVRQLTFHHESVSSPGFSWDGKRLLTYVDANGNERYSIYSVRYPEGGDLIPLVDNGDFNAQVSFSRDSKNIAYSSGEPWSGNLTIKNLRTGKERMFEGTMPVMSTRWSPDGRKIAFVKGIFSCAKLMILDVKTGDIEEVPDTTNWVNIRAWNDNGILVSDFDESGIMQLRIWNGAWSTTVVSRYEKQEARYSSQMRLAYGENRNGQVALVVQEPSGERIDVFATGVNFSFAWEGEVLVFVHASSQTCGEIWMYDALTRKKERVLDLMPQSVARSSLARAKIVRYRSFDGREISGFLYTPKNFTEKRAIVFPHGGPTGESQDSWFALVQYMVNRGFMVLEPNYRGSTGYGREFLELNIGDLGGGDLEDMVYAARFLEENYVGVGRVAIAGISYGGYLTMAAMTMRPEVFAAGVGISIIFDWETEYANETLHLKEYDEILLRGTPETSPLYKERSPAQYIHQVCRSLMIVQGGQDPRTPVQEAFGAAEALSKAGKPYKLIVYGDEGHYPERIENLVDMAEQMMNFLEIHLLVP